MSLFRWVRSFARAYWTRPQALSMALSQRVPQLQDLLLHLRQAPALLVSVTRTAGWCRARRALGWPCVAMRSSARLAAAELEHQAIAHARASCWPAW